MRTIRIILIVVAIFLFSQFNSVAAAAALKLSISFDKSEYGQTDPVYINFKLENKSRKPLYVNKRFFINSEHSRKEEREVYLTVASPSGEELPAKAFAESGLPKTDYFVLLKPKEEVSSERKRNISYYFDFKDPGVYKITATYQNVYGKEIGINVFKGKIKSKPVTIKIVE